jgi:hypothetical protein
MRLKNHPDPAPVLYAVLVYLQEVVGEEPEGGGGLLAVGGHGAQRQPLIRPALAVGATVTHYSTPPCAVTL